MENAAEADAKGRELFKIGVDEGDIAQIHGRVDLPEATSKTTKYISKPSTAE